MFVRKKEILELSENIRKTIDGQAVDFRDNKEGAMSVLKNDIYTLVSQKDEQLKAINDEHAFMTEFVGNISHQLKTPITSMMIMTDLLENASVEKQEEFTHNIKVGLTRMEWLVSTLLKIAKLDAGTVTFEKKKITGSELLASAMEPLAVLLDVKNQTILLQTDTELFCDSRWTAEALMNLIKNASEYSEENTTIDIACGDNPIYQWISVTDSGNGIAKEDVSELFKRFEGSRSETGYGIGLPLALSIIRGQNGDIDVEPGGKGKGATFIVKFFK